MLGGREVERKGMGAGGVVVIVLEGEVEEAVGEGLEVSGLDSARREM